MGIGNEVILMFCTFVITCTVGQQNNNEQSNEYIQAFLGYHINGHVIGTMTSLDIWSCVATCRRTSGCLSLNTRNHSDGMVYCALTKSNRQSFGINLIASSLPGQQYLELQSECFPKVGWTKFKSFAYKYISDKVNAATARQRCRELAEGADLVSISNAEEQQFVVNLFKDTSWDFVWIGMNDINKEGTFVWYDGSPTKYTNWGMNEPNGGTGENCVQFYAPFGVHWVDNSCQASATFVCKINCRF